MIVIFISLCTKCLPKANYIVYIITTRGVKCKNYWEYLDAQSSIIT